MFLTYRKIVVRWVALMLSVDAVSANSSDETYFPADVKICSTKDPNFNTCFINSANRMLKHLVTGMRKLNAVPMDPLRVPFISLQRNNTLVPTLAFNYSNTIHEGWKDAVVLSSEINPKDYEFNMVFRVPRYRVRNSYEISGSIIGIPLEGAGEVDVVFFNMTNDIQLRGHLEGRNAQEFLVIDDFKQKTHVDDINVNFNNLFNNSKLTEATNKLLNLNGRALLDEGNGVMNEIWGAIHLGLMQRIFDRVPYRVMFPDLD